MALPVLRLLVCAAILAVFALGIFDYLKNFEENGCEMTYMFQRPQYLPVPLDRNTSNRYPRYGLYLYAEGRYADRSKDMNLDGIPVLFIPGNAGSYKQVRSLGSVALRMAEDSKSPFHFNYFSIDFNEELSGLFGGILQDQTEFAAACVQHILSLYKTRSSPPKSVVLVGHSMGGMVARAVFTLKGFKARHVSTVITQATPHQAPVVAMDTMLQQFYDDVNAHWARHHNTTLKEVTVVSTGGGHRDMLVRSHLTSLERIVDDENAVSSNTMAVPRAFVSTDHLCHVWCKQVVLATKRALFNAVDKKTKQIAAGPGYRRGVFEHHLVRNPGARAYKGAYDQLIRLDPDVKWEVRKKSSWATSKDSLSSTRYSVVELPKVNLEDKAYVAVSNIENTAWVGVCALQGVGKKREERCRTAVNHAPTAAMLPPAAANSKAVHIGPDDLEGQTHIIAVLPQSDTKVEVAAELYAMSVRHLEVNVTDLLAFITGLPHSVTALQVPLPASQPGAVFYNLTLRGLAVPLQAYTAHLTCLQCTGAPAEAKIVAQLHVPWANEDTYSLIPAGENGTVPLKLQSGRPNYPDDEMHPQLHLYLHPACTYRLALTISWTELYGQLVRFYATFLPAFVAVNVLMALIYQLKQLDEHGIIPDLVSAHSLYSQPWRVVPLSLLARFMLYFPDEMPLADRLHLPRDDSAGLRAQHVWYAALPIILYVIANALVSFYAVFLTGVLSVIGRFYGLVFGRCCLSVRCVEVMSVLEYTVYLSCVPIAYFTCGSIALVLIYFIVFIKTIWSYVVAKYSGLKPQSVWNTHHVYCTLLLLQLLLVSLNAPPLIVWAKNLSHNVFTLESDPSRPLGITMATVAMLLSYSRFPRISNDIYGAAASVLYAAAVLMLVMCLSSLHRISYFLVALLLLLALCSAALNYSATHVTTQTSEPVDEPATGEVRGEGEGQKEQENGAESSASEASTGNGDSKMAAVTKLRKRSAKKA